MNQLNNLTTTNIYVTVWKDQNATYFPSGTPRQINCQHQQEGYFGVNIRGEVFPMSNTTFVPGSTPPASPPASDYEQQTALVKEGNTYKHPYPFATSNANFKICIRVKDLTTQITSYCDATDYLAKIVGCNPVPYVSS